MPKDGAAPLATWLVMGVMGGEHVYSPMSDEDGRSRWECACGAVGRWGKTADRLHPGWQAHMEEEMGSVGIGETG